jgi:hypothetical protein
LNIDTLWKSGSFLLPGSLFVSGFLYQSDSFDSIGFLSQAGSLAIPGLFARRVCAFQLQTKSTLHRGGTPIPYRPVFSIRFP